MYPVDEAVYYDAASPIKIFEYTAAGKPVVVPRITEAERLGFENLVFASPEVQRLWRRDCQSISTAPGTCF